eukprot:CAMPEP_0196152186 /NCGR_PEP_ID=MMETSP0910-20130528/35046_1 /TAXON_ID=49265 /ORGANISM="Thalassiosira rotula, Strain GSO102" /LENGTH=60 /DNA_ID=CAMNT_0041415725 /DNA_START=78 /DNA_END=257 /DNA_ORIENTATION=+
MWPVHVFGLAVQLFSSVAAKCPVYDPSTKYFRASSSFAGACAAMSPFVLQPSIDTVSQYE